MSPQERINFEEWLTAYARKRGLWVYSLREILAESFTAGIYYESRGLQ